MTEDVTIQGALRISVEIDSDGAFVVDDSNDTMYIGGSSAQDRLFTVEGLGSFEVSDSGTLVFDRCKLLASNPGGGETAISWDLSGSGSEIELADWSIGGQGTIDWDITMSGGTLDIDRSFSTSGDLDISGGTADVGHTVDITGSTELSGGTLLIDYTNTFTGDIDMSGGTLDIDESFTGDGDFVFSGGTIKVKAGKVAAFTPND